VGGDLLVPGAVEQPDQVVQGGGVADFLYRERVGGLLVDRRSDLDSQLGPWRAKYPEVPAERELVAGRPDRVLVRRSRQAQLVVVGPRRHGFDVVLLGSVGTRLVERADCPVRIARS
jgi:nucleotide-binding universal stress UspA family protein